MNGSEIATRPVEGEVIERFEEYGIKVTIQSYVVEFSVKEIIGETMSPSPAGLWLYTKAGATDCSDGTTDFAEGEGFLSGSIKWDGCSNWDFHTDECMAHFCGRKHATSIGRLMDRLYQITKDRLPTYDEDLAE